MGTQKLSEKISENMRCSKTDGHFGYHDVCQGDVSNRKDTFC